MDVLATRAAERLLVTLCAPLLLFIGYKLFALGATGKMAISAKTTTGSVKLSNLAPGALCFVLGSVLATYVMFKEAVVSETVGKDGTKKIDTKFLDGTGTNGDGVSVSISDVRTLYRVTCELLKTPGLSEDIRKTSKDVYKAMYERAPSDIGDEYSMTRMEVCGR